MLYFKTTITVENGPHKYFYTHVTRKTSRTFKNLTFRKKKHSGGVFVVGNNRLHTLTQKQNSAYSASLPQNGKNGHNLLLTLPVGTCVYNKKTMKLLFLVKLHVPELVLSPTIRQRLSLFLMYAPPTRCAFASLTKKLPTNMLSTFTKLLFVKQQTKSSIIVHNNTNNYDILTGRNQKFFSVYLPFVFTQNGFLYNKPALRQTLFTRVFFLTACCCRNVSSVVNFICNVLDILYTSNKQREMFVFVVYNKNTRFSKFYYEAWVKAVTVFLGNCKIQTSTASTFKSSTDTCKKGLLYLRNLYVGKNC